MENIEIKSDMEPVHIHEQACQPACVFWFLEMCEWGHDRPDYLEKTKESA